MMLKRLAIFDTVLKIITIVVLALTFVSHSVTIGLGEFMISVLFVLSFITTITMHMEIIFPIDRKE